MKQGKVRLTLYNLTLHGLWVQNCKEFRQFNKSLIIIIAYICTCMYLNKK